MNEKIALLAEWLQESKQTVLLTGAGMSTESGLPDFRSNQGLWHGRDPQEIASVTALRHNREDFISFYQWRIKELNKYKPHEGHYVLARWEKEGLVKTVITQNVDGFHHQAGSRQVVELHGSLWQITCLDCDYRTEAGRYLEEKGTICPSCGGFLRPDIILFGEMLDRTAIETAVAEASQADLLLVLGSSLQVSPANLLPLETKRAGGRLVIVNLDDTEMDGEADLIINGKIGDVLGRLDQLLQSQG